MKPTVTVHRIRLAAVALIVVIGCATLTACGTSSANSGAATSGASGDQPTSPSTTPPSTPTPAGAFPTPVIHRGAGLAAPGQSPPVPLVIALHGGGGATPALFENATRLDPVADSQGFVVAYLGSPLPLWKAPSDITYIGSMISQLTASENIDPQRVYVVGFSLGGYATFRSACQLSSQVAAVAIVSSAMAPLWRKPCPISRPVSELSIVGTSDLFPVHQTSSSPISADQTASMWRQLDGCSSQSQTSQVGPAAQTTWSQCNDGTTVGEYVLAGGLHRWPGSPGSVGADAQYAAAPALWSFLSQHSSSSSSTVSATLSSVRVSGGRSRQVRVVLAPLVEASVLAVVTLTARGHLIASKRFNGLGLGPQAPLVLAVPKRTKRGRYTLQLGLRDSYGRTLTIVRAISVPSRPTRPGHNRRRPSRHAG
jgi:polyhydroxybutyrate depolymerase